MRRSLLSTVLLTLSLLFAAAPGAETPPRQILTQCLPEQLCFQGVDFGDRFELRFRNDVQATFTVAAEVRAKDGSGRQSSTHFVTRAPESRLLLSLAFPDGPTGVRWAYTYHPGSEPAEHDDSHVYALPYVSGSSHIVVQAYDGAFTHKGALRYAVDWRMPEGTPVLAARAGTVIGAHDRSHEGGHDNGMFGRENYVWLRHADGTVGQYLHLAPDSLAVSLGEQVEVGQVLARSGNTGYSVEPHLHFHVSTPTQEGPHAFVTFPVKFRLSHGRIESPRRGRRMRAP